MTVLLGCQCLRIAANSQTASASGQLSLVSCASDDHQCLPGRDARTTGGISSEYIACCMTPITPDSAPVEHQERVVAGAEWRVTAASTVSYVILVMIMNRCAVVGSRFFKVRRAQLSS
eukprot:2832702-Pleurochrysis_carterae.AAC.1